MNLKIFILFKLVTNFTGLITISVESITFSYYSKKFNDDAERINVHTMKYIKETNERNL